MASWNTQERWKQSARRGSQFHTINHNTSILNLDTHKLAAVANAGFHYTAHKVNHQLRIHVKQMYLYLKTMRSEVFPFAFFNVVICRNETKRIVLLTIFAYTLTINANRACVNALSLLCGNQYSFFIPASLEFYDDFTWAGYLSHIVMFSKLACKNIKERKAILDLFSIFF